jgi:pimeloyl-ACP methyl ester carboxylesterase
MREMLRRASVLLVVALAAGGLLGAAEGVPAGTDDGLKVACRQVTFPAGGSGWTLAATACRPDGQVPQAAVVLVHGSTNNGTYWDPPGAEVARHSVPRILARRGYLVVNVDRLGFGRSTRPPQVTADDSIAALHTVIAQLRSEPRWRTASGKVALVGHSSGSSLIIRTAATHPGDVDALVVTGMFHTFSEVEPPLFPAMLHPARDDPRFADDPTIPDGYETTEPTTTVLWHFAHTGNSSLEMLELAERRLKDAQPAGDSGGFEAEVFVEPLSPLITVPVLSVYGDRDVSRCGSPACPQADAEAAFWPASPSFSLARVRDTAHAINLHRNARTTTNRIGDWLDRHSR